MLESHRDPITGSCGSLFDPGEIERLAQRSRGGRQTESRLATITTGVTQLPARTSGPLYRGRQATALSRWQPTTPSRRWLTALLWQVEPEARSAATGRHPNSAAVPARSGRSRWSACGGRWSCAGPPTPCGPTCDRCGHAPARPASGHCRADRRWWGPADGAPRRRPHSDRSAIGPPARREGIVGVRVGDGGRGQRPLSSSLMADHELATSTMAPGAPGRIGAGRRLRRSAGRAGHVGRTRCTALAGASRQLPRTSCSWWPSGTEPWPRALNVRPARTGAVLPGFGHAVYKEQGRPLRCAAGAGRAPAHRPERRASGAPGGRPGGRTVPPRAAAQLRPGATAALSWGTEHAALGRRARHPRRGPAHRRLGGPLPRSELAERAAALPRPAACLQRLNRPLSPRCDDHGGGVAPPGGWVDPPRRRPGRGTDTSRTRTATRPAPGAPVPA